MVLLENVSLDCKAMSDNYWKITRSDLFSPFGKSLEILLASQVRFELRTTVHSELLSGQDLGQMENWLRGKGYSGTFYLQHFRGDKETLGELGESKKQGLETESGVLRN